MGFDGGEFSGVGRGGVAVGGVGLVAGAAEAVGEGFGWAGAAAVGAFDEEAAGGGRGVGWGAWGGRQPGWQFVDEAAAEESGGGVDLGGESCGEGAGEVVGGVCVRSAEIASRAGGEGSVSVGWGGVRWGGTAVGAGGSTGAAVRVAASVAR